MAGGQTEFVSMPDGGFLNDLYILAHPESDFYSEQDRIDAALRIGVQMTLTAPLVLTPGPDEALAAGAMTPGSTLRGALPAGKVLGTATPVAQHLNVPWYRFLRPSYTGKIAIAPGLDEATLARTLAHESQHVADFARFPGITHLAIRPKFFPGRGAARYFLEFRGYRTGGEVRGLGDLGVPLRSLNTELRLNLGFDVTFFGGGAAAGGYLNYREIQ